MFSFLLSCTLAAFALLIGIAPANYGQHAPESDQASMAIPLAIGYTGVSAQAPNSSFLSETKADVAAPDILSFKKPTALERARAALAERGAKALSNPELCTILIEVARKNELPLTFFTNLIWQESRFNHEAISPVGAMGVAQFMPDVAESLSLDAFDMRSALPASGQLLRTLRARFGNLGLAAAAYNAGPRRVTDWLERRASLPKETHEYVRVITGRPATYWQNATARASIVSRAASRVPCYSLASFVDKEQAERAEQARALADQARLAKLKMYEARLRSGAQSIRHQLASRLRSKTAVARRPIPLRLAQLKR